jgi:outer membrane protein
LKDQQSVLRIISFECRAEIHRRGAKQRRDFAEIILNTLRFLCVLRDSAVKNGGWLLAKTIVCLCLLVWQTSAQSPVEPADANAAVTASIRSALGGSGNFLVPPQSGRKPEPPPKPDSPQITLPQITLEDVLQNVDRNHPKLRGANLQRDIASFKRLEKQGAFDPVVFAGSDYLRFNTEFDAKTQRGKVGEMRVADAGIEFQTRYGVKIGAGTRFNLGKVKSPLSPTGSGGEYFMEFKIPFLRGARINEKSAAERQAFLGEPMAQAEYELTRLELLLKAANSYWDWATSKGKLDVARNLLKLAEFRADAVRQRVSAGDLPQIDATEADLEVQRRQGGVIKSERDLQKAAFKLSVFLWGADGRPIPSPEESQAPTRLAPPVVFTSQQAEEGQRSALARRPELQMLSLDRQINQVDLELARNQRLPAVDFSFSPGRDTGLGAIGNTAKASVSFSLPLRQRNAEGRIGSALSKIQKVDFDLLNERQRITVEVLDALNAINTAYDRYRAAAQEVDLAERLEEGERTKFQLGDSTLFLVNQRERSTAEARMKLIEIQAEYEQAAATFRAATAQF